MSRYPYYYIRFRYEADQEFTRTIPDYPAKIVVEIWERNERGEARIIDSRVYEAPKC